MAHRGGYNVGRPHQAQGRRMAFSSTFYEVSKIIQSNTRKVSKPPLQMFTFPLRWGDGQAEDKCAPEPGQYSSPTV